MANKLTSDPRSSIHRRDFLGGSAALGAAALSPVAKAQGQPTADASPHRIDVHHHFMTPRSVEETRPKFMREISGMNNSHVLEWTVEKSLAAMDEAGVATAMLSLNSPGPWSETKEGSRSLCRHCNEFAAQAQADHPGRFGHFASLPLPDVDGSLAEAAYALDVLKADGFVMRTSDEDKWLGEPSYWPLYEELNRRKAVVFVHPATPACCQEMNMVSPPALLEYPFDTARAITNWIYSGAGAQFPDIRLIFTHGGGAMLMILDRLAAVVRVKPELAERVPQGALEMLKSYFFDTALVYNEPAFAAMRAALPLSQILLGSDTPYIPIAPSVAALSNLVPEPTALRAIERDNALALFPRLA
ncbi:amidohydrolase family protein [Croceicoccus sediminis]|uniref:amidohydrolase family protein n=1 Tax=Croceicoccus sediminis TaxID=2571150 RepID=UPI001182AB9B|nr:amidohydrolase family protein [Croceicoccus sediminis]